MDYMRNPLRQRILSDPHFMPALSSLAPPAWGHALIIPGLLFCCMPVAAESENPTPWSYQRIQRPAIPVTKDTTWPKDDLDRFILARLEQENLRPIGDASRATLIRRASFDLRGLPPSQS